MLSLIQNDIMLAVLETENLYVYISSLSSISPWLSFSPLLLSLLQYHFISLFEPKIEPLTMPLSKFLVA